MPSKKPFEYDPRIGGYRDTQTGRKMSQASVLREAENYHETVLRPNITETTDRFIDGKYSIEQWQEKMTQHLRDAWRDTAVAGRGGKKHMTYSDYGKLGSRLRQEYRYLRNFAQGIKDGKYTEAQIRAIADQYADGPRTAYFDGKTAAMRDDAGMTEERRILGASEHCENCIAYAAMGWQPIGTLPEPGTQCLGRHRCKCTKEYR
jgi:hypothetical protein